MPVDAQISPILEDQPPAGTPLAEGGITGWVLATLAALLAFGVYVATLFPGLHGLGDAAKFSFVGRVLGIPHEPGYPLYVVISHLFSYLPLGTLAYRMNLLSAVLAAVAVALGFGLVRSLGGGRQAAIASALAMGFGNAFWAKALYAKGYTLNAALISAGMLMLLRWSATRRRSHLFWAVGIFAASVGSHLIVLALLPALVLYALLTAPREVLRGRTVLLVVLLVLLGLSQYGLIIIRTIQQAPYLEARATNLGELWQVMTARRYAGEIFAFSWATLVAVRIPAVLGVVGRELGTLGVSLLTWGVITLLISKPREVVLLGAGALGVGLLTANMSSNEDEGFLLAAIVLLWPLFGIGLDQAVTTLRRLPRRPAALAALGLAAWLPADHVVDNYRTHDHHRRTFEIRYFQSLFDMLPARSALVVDKYDTRMMVLYKLLGEQASGHKEVRSGPLSAVDVTRAVQDGCEVYTLGLAHARLAAQGFGFSPVRLLDAPLPYYLENVRDGFIVLVAAMPGAAQGLRPEELARLRSLGASPEFLTRTGSSYVLVGVRATARRALENGGPGTAGLRVSRDQAIGDTRVRAPAALTVVADESHASIAIGGSEVVRSTAGAVVAVISPQGVIVEAHVLDPATRLQVPIDMKPLPLFHLTRAAQCADVGNTGWQNLTHLAVGRTLTLRVDNFGPFDTTATLWIASDVSLDPRVTIVGGRGKPVSSVRLYVPGDREGRASMARQIAADQATPAGQLEPARFVYRIEISVNDEGDHAALMIDLGRRPATVLARVLVDQQKSDRATVCGVPDGRP